MLGVLYDALAAGGAVEAGDDVGEPDGPEGRNLPLWMVRSM